MNLRSFWQLQGIGWGCFYISDLLGSIHALLSGQDSIRDETVCVFFMFLGSCALRPFCHWLFHRSQSWLSFELKAAAGALVAGNLVTLGAGLLLHWPVWAPIAMWASFVLFMWCSLYFSIKQWLQSSEEKERLLRADTAVREARLLALRSQLNPHFLFNSLNAVSTLVMDDNPEAATQMLAQIGDLLRSCLDSDLASEVPLSQEMVFTEGYLAIEQTRLGERLRCDIVVPPEARDALVPSMLLQPLVENAVRYGAGTLIEGGWVSIRCSLDANRLRIIIGNSGRRGVGERREVEKGIGLKNTTERLKALYGASHTFSLNWLASGGCEVTMELPYHC